MSTKPDRRLLVQFMGNTCVACGDTVTDLTDQFGDVISVFEFNHVDPDTKHPNYENLMRRNLSEEQITEVEKCILLCNKCHRIIHAQDKTVSFTVTCRAQGGYERSQTILGCVMTNQKTRIIQFLSNERLSIVPHILIMPDGSQKIVSLGELRDSLVIDLLKSLRTGEMFQVADHTGRLLLRVTRKDPEIVRLEMEMSCGLFDAILEAPDEPKTFFRRGKLLQRPTTFIEHGRIDVDLEVQEIGGND